MVIYIKLNGNYAYTHKLVSSSATSGIAEYAFVNSVEMHVDRAPTNSASATRSNRPQSASIKPIRPEQDLNSPGTQMNLSIYLSMNLFSSLYQVQSSRYPMKE